MNEKDLLVAIEKLTNAVEKQTLELEKHNMPDLYGNFDLKQLNKNLEQLIPLLKKD